MDLTQHFGTIITLLVNVGAIVYTFGNLATRLQVAEKALEELRADVRLLADLRASIAEIRVSHSHNTTTLSRLERLIEGLAKQ